LFKVLTETVAAQFQNFRVSINVTHSSLPDDNCQAGLSTVLRKLAPKMLSGVHKTQRISSALIFLERYHIDVDQYIDEIVGVTSDESLIFVREC
jgi:hypothetical protein